MTDIDDFDLDRSIAEGWAGFQARLSEVISMMDDSGDLTISAESEGEGVAPFLRFSAVGSDRLRCEVASNANLGPTHRLSGEQLEAMRAMGWHEATADGQPPTASFWVEETAEECDRVSELAVAALRDVFGVPHPVFLAPDQLAEVLRGPTPGEPGVAMSLRGTAEPGAQQRLDALVDVELSELYGHPPVRDGEGDVAIRVGSTMVFLRTSRDGQEVVVFAAVVHDIDGRSRATEVLNDLNVEARWVKFQLVRDRVFVSLSVLARPFVAEHLRQAVRIMSEVADGIDEELAAKLHGRTTFSDRDGG